MNQSPRRKHRVVPILLVMAVAGAGMWAYYGTNSRAKAPAARRAPPAIPVTVAPARTAAVPLSLQSIGNVEAYASVAIKARVDGQIVEVRLREGQPVRKGDVLFRIDPRPLEAALRQAEANAQRDRAAREQAQSQAKRFEELFAKNFVSKEAYAQIRTNAETAEATAKASQAALDHARLNLEYATIRAPLDGYTGKVLLQAGNLVKANDVASLVIINQVRPIYVSFAVPEQNLAELRRRMAQGTLSVEATPSGAGRPAGGELVFVDNSVDAATGTIRLRARFANPDLTLWPGQFVNVSVRLFEQHDALVVPSLAVQTGPEGNYVYVVTDDLGVALRHVSVERTVGELAVVAKGLQPGEKVVTTGQLRLGPKSKVQIREPGEKPAADGGGRDRQSAKDGGAKGAGKGRPAAGAQS